MSDRSDIVAGIVIVPDPWPDRATIIADAAQALVWRLESSTVWQSGYLPAELRGGVAFGTDLAWWRPPTDVTAEEAATLEAAWSAALPPLDRGMRRYLRLRVSTPDDVHRLRAIGEVDGLRIAPSLPSRGRGIRPLCWRWPLRVGVVPGALADEWSATLRDTSHYGSIFDAEVFDASHTYEIAIVSASELRDLSADWKAVLGEVPCVIAAGDEPIDELLRRVDEDVRPAIAIAVGAPPELWWRELLYEMSHDVPIDAAVESVVRSRQIEALIAGPRWGLDITASAHWFAAVAVDFPELAPALDEFAGWDWMYESGGTSNVAYAVRAVRERGGDPYVYLNPPAAAGPPPPDDFDASDGLGAGPEELAEAELPEAVGAEPPEPVEAEPAKPTRPVRPRHLVANVFDGETQIMTILPPSKELTFAVRIAIPRKGDTVADKAAPSLPEAPGPTVELEVAVRGGVWAEPPAPQKISISRENLAEPSSWAAFPFTTPEAGGVVSIEILVLYRGKPLQAATYVSPVRAAAVPGEKPTLTVFALSGPNEPSEELRPVDAILDGTGAELQHWRRTGARVLITDVQDMLDSIEERVSRVLGVPGAPESFDDERGRELLVTLARIGTQLATFLDPLDLDKAMSINVLIGFDTRVLPLELVYAGPPPKKTAKLCDHVKNPPPVGESCDKASTARVCPYAFWGLHRSIARTVVSGEDDKKSAPWTPTLATSSVLYAATDIADAGATGPLPSDGVFTFAQGAFQPATRVTSWTAWRKAIKTKPTVLVLLGHTMVEGAELNLYIGKDSHVSTIDLSEAHLRTKDSPRPLVLLIACASAALGDPFGSLPGALTAKGAGAVVGTLSKIVGPQGAAATTHLLRTVHDLAGTDASVGDAVAAARRSLIAEQRPIGLILVSHGELDTKVSV